MAARATLAGAIALALGVGVVAPAGAAVKLHRCDLGAARPLRCGHIEAPMRRGDPSLGTTKVAFAVRPRGDRSRPSLGTILAIDGGPGYGSTAAPFVRSVNAALAPLLRRRELVLCRRPRDRPLGRPRLPHPAARPDPRKHRDRRMREPARPALRRLHDRRNRRRPRRGPRSARARQGLLLRRLLRDPARPGLRGPPSRQPAGADPRLRLPGRRPLLPDAAAGRPARAADRLPPRARLLRRRRRPLLPRRPPLPRRRDGSTEDLLGFLLQAGTLAPRSYLSLDEGDRRFLAGEPRRLEPPDRARPARPRRAPRILLRARDRRRVQRLPAALGPVARRSTSGSASSRPSVTRLPARLLRAFRPREYLLSPAAHLTNCLTWPAPPPGGLEPPVPAGWRAPTQLPDPDPRRPGRRRHLGRGGATGEAALPPLAPLRGARPRPRLEPLLPVPLAGGRRDPEVHSHQLTARAKIGPDHQKPSNEEERRCQLTW